MSAVKDLPDKNVTNVHQVTTTILNVRNVIVTQEDPLQQLMIQSLLAMNSGNVHVKKWLSDEDVIGVNKVHLDYRSSIH